MHYDVSCQKIIFVYFIYLQNTRYKIPNAGGRTTESLNNILYYAVCLMSILFMVSIMHHHNMILLYYFYYILSLIV